MQVALYVPSGSKAEIAALEKFCFHRHKILGEPYSTLNGAMSCGVDAIAVSSLSALHRTTSGILRNARETMARGFPLVCADRDVVLKPAEILPFLYALDLRKPTNGNRHKRGPQRKTAVDSIKHGPKIAKLLGSGSTVRQASEACGVAPGTVMRVRKMLELGK